jgi:5-methylcytosine-specific restriction endonuclease McrA
VKPFLLALKMRKTKYCKVCMTNTDRDSEGKCKCCKNKRQAKWRKENRDYFAVWRESNPSYQSEWASKNKDKKLNYDALYRAKHSEKIKLSKLVWSFSNREKLNAYARNYYEKNKEKIKIRYKAWAVNNSEFRRIHHINRRARKLKAGGKLSLNLSSRLFALQKGKCACCRKKLSDDYHMDHIMPLALGGLNEDKNIQLLCAKCNLQKHATHPIDFMQRKGFLL